MMNVRFFVLHVKGVREIAVFLYVRMSIAIERSKSGDFTQRKTFPAGIEPTFKV